MAQVGQRVAASMQADLVAHLVRLDSAFFTRTPPGTLIERVRGDTQAAAALPNTVIAAVGRDGVALISLFAVALSNDWLWTLIAVGAAPLLAIPAGRLQRQVRSASREGRMAAARLSTRLDEIFHGVNSVKLSGTEDREARRYADELDGFVRFNVRAQAAQAGIPALMDVVAGIGMLGVLSYGGMQIIAGDKTVGDFMSFFTAMALVFEPLRRLGAVSGAWIAARASLERVHHLFELRPSILPPASPRALPVPAGQADIELRDVRFGYGDQPVLDGLNLTARAGRTTAIVGPSGAGKSTVFSLLTRLVEPQSGQVTLAGVPVSDLPLADLRDCFSVVTQDAALFDESIRDNIQMGGDAPSPELQAAVTAAHLDPVISAMSSGLDTPAGPRGSALSGGQRQRVAIARALLRDRPILLFDEATSALDAGSEAAVQEALEKLSAGRTTLVIAHRLSTVRQADSIVVMDRGRVVEQGAHDALIAQGGLYARLHAMQFKD